MVKRLLKYNCLLLSALLIASCSELNDNITSKPDVQVHKKGILDTTSSNFHGMLVRELMWDLNNCKQCHASDYSGGITGSSCLTCHSQPDGPEACNTCHGDFENPDRIAPPEDTKNNYDSDSVGVGAHEKHLFNSRGKDIFCSTCHKVPQSVYETGHVDDKLPAEINFSLVAVINLGSNSTYNYGTSTCSETYCHGNWEFLKDSSSNQFAYTADKMTGNNLSVVWNQVDGSQAECGSCHNLPPEGHIAAQLSACGGCHSGIVDSNGEIVDSLRYKHINGEKNVFGN
jgi:hypothetical protein